jgi:hypothetical protein
MTTPGSFSFCIAAASVSRTHQTLRAVKRRTRRAPAVWFCVLGIIISEFVFK